MILDLAADQLGIELVRGSLPPGRRKVADAEALFRKINKLDAQREQAVKELEASFRAMALRKDEVEEENVALRKELLHFRLRAGMDDVQMVAKDRRVLLDRLDGPRGPRLEQGRAEPA